MPISIKYCNKFILSAFIFVFGLSSQLGLSEVNHVILKNETIDMNITPDLGGRVLHFSVPSLPNILSFGENSIKTLPSNISATSDFISYLGHINWLSPQSQWWTNQNLNLSRKKNQSIWPPDPYLIYPTNRVIHKSKHQLVLEGADSPVSGVRLKKTFSLVKGVTGTADLSVEATNILDKDVSWGIWFNTRVNPRATVYVPIRDKNSVRIENYDPEQNLPVKFLIKDKFLSFQHYEVQDNDKSIRGKAFVKPREGWMAAFMQKQAFIIQFPLKEDKKIHQEHGQIEIYHQYRYGNQYGGQLEMEVHTPFLEIKPNESIAATERWMVIPYSGKNTQEAHLSFLDNLAGLLK